MADGEDAISLTVIDEGARKDVTASAEIYLGKDLYTGTSFSTSTPGNYTFKAIYNGVTSNTITVTALSGASADGITLKTSKTSIYSDGGDFAVLTLVNAEGVDVTAQGEFFANDEKITGNRFRTTKGSLTPVKITATFNKLAVAGSASVTATSNYVLPGRMLIEDITRTNCQFCPYIIRLIDELRKDNPQTVVAYSLHNPQSSVYGSEYSTATKTFVEKYCTLMDAELTSAPQVFPNRSKTKLNNTEVKAQELRSEAAKGAKEVGIAIESTADASSVTVKATIGSKRSFAGKVVAVLVESGIYAAQQDMGTIEMYRIMRAYAPSAAGQSLSLTQGTPVSFDATFDLSVTTVKNIGNCEVIVFVTDDADGLCKGVQYAKVGEAKGY